MSKNHSKAKKNNNSQNAYKNKSQEKKIEKKIDKKVEDKIEKNAEKTIRGEINPNAYISGFGILLALFIIVPLIAELIVPAFERLSYGQKQEFFRQVIISIILGVGFVAFTIAYRKIVFKGTVKESIEVHELPAKVVVVLFVLTIGAIALISSQINFEVKPFYDMGVKLNGYILMGKIATMIKNAIKCFYIVMMIRLAQEYFEAILPDTIKFKNKFIWGGLAVMLTMGVLDLIMGYTTLPLIYFLLYPLFGWIYLLTEKDVRKTIILTLLIYFL